MADSTLPESLVRYLAARDAQRADDVRSILDALTPREQRLVMDAAVMGYVRGKMSGHDDPVPKNGAILGETVDACLTHRDAILREVVGACQSFPDLYAVLTGVRPCGGCDHPEYAHRNGDDEAETPGVCLQCEHDGADDANHDYRTRSRP
jgi:hypothetical protein